MKIEKINLNKQNRMIRIGLGYHESIFFIRLDLWYFGVRFKND